MYKINGFLKNAVIKLENQNVPLEDLWFKFTVINIDEVDFGDYNLIDFVFSNDEDYEKFYSKDLEDKLYNQVEFIEINWNDVKLTNDIYID